MWDYKSQNFTPIDIVLDSTSAERERNGVTFTQMWQFICDLFNKLESERISTPLEYLREDVGEHPKPQQIWGVVDEDTTGRVVECDTQRSCVPTCTGDMLSLTTFPTVAGYGRITDREGGATVEYCSCTMGRAITSPTHCYGLVQTAICRFPDLVGANAINIDSPVKDIRRAFWLARYTEKQRSFNTERWDVMCGNTISTETWDRLFMAIHSARVSGQVRSLMWRITMRCLPLLGYAHWRKHLRIASGICVLCGTENETFVHLFCECPTVQPLWEEVHHLLSKMHLPTSWAHSNSAKLIGMIRTGPTSPISWMTEEAPSESSVMRYTTRVWAEVRGQVLNSIWMVRNKVCHNAEFDPPNMALYIQSRFWHQLRLVAIGKMYPPKDLPAQSPNQLAFTRACWNPATVVILDKLGLTYLLQGR